MEEKIIELLQNNGYKITTIFLFVLLFVVLTNIENIILIQSKIYGIFSGLFVFAKKGQMSKKVRGTILKSIKAHPLDNNILPSDLKVEWINKEEKETFFQNNQVIVRIKQSSNPHENLVTAISEYVNNGLLYNVKRYLNKEVMDVSRILMTRKVVQTADKSSLTYLDENYIIPKFESNLELKELYDDLVKIDNNGMFIGIMLNEFNKAGLTISGSVEDPLLFAESKEFMRFLYNIANRTSTDPTNLCFNREYFKVVIFLTASTYTLNKSGIKPFIKVARKQLDAGIETIYVFGLGSKRETAKQISNELDSDLRIAKIIKHVYKHISNEDGKRVPGVFYECEIYKDDEKDA